VLLNTGDVFTYEFTLLPQVVPGSAVGDTPVGAFSFFLSFEPCSGALFENGANQPPLLTFVAEGSSAAGTVRFTCFRVWEEMKLWPNTAQTGVR
jgi:hypothetical protein